MKIRIVVIMLMMMMLGSCSSYRVYSMRDKPLSPVDGGVLYALPKTQLCIAVTVAKRDFSDAPFRDYAVEYIGVSERDIDSTFKITDIDVSTLNVADNDNYFMVKMRRGSLTVDGNHLLLAVGMANPTINHAVEHPSLAVQGSGTTPVAAEYNLYDRADTLYSRYDKPGKPTYISTRKDSRSLRQRAMAAAERLEAIQAKRQELLDGDYEGSYSREAIDYLNRQLEKQEAAIVAQFCGVMRSETVRFYVEPSFKKREEMIDTVAWLSSEYGLMGYSGYLPDDAMPVVYSVSSTNTLGNANRFVKYHTSGITAEGRGGRSGKAYMRRRASKCIRYRIPEIAMVEVNYGDMIVRKQVKLSQLGPVMTLPRRRVKALFDAQTLDLVKIIY